MRLLLLTVLLVVCGCATTPESKYLQAESTFQTTVMSLIELRRAGVLDDKDVKVLTPIINQINRELRVWRESLVNGNPRPDLAKSVFKALQKLLEIKGEIEARRTAQ